TLGDLAFTLQTLATVNITGAEVEAYVDVNNTFMKVFEQARKDQKKEGDTVSVEMTIQTANNFLELLLIVSNFNSVFSSFTFLEVLQEDKLNNKQEKKITLKNLIISIIKVETNIRKDGIIP
ncbi:MAG: hypothetical protein EBS55_08450, partial [Flavobacteriaceae bacterium]|nr:hypothetical protein [Flavobacteriaceae bacterium]